MDKPATGIAIRGMLNYSAAGNPAFSLDLDLTLPGRGITAIFGESGSGKTSLLRLIAGLEKSPDGYLSVNGEIWQDDTRFLATHRRALGYVFQEASLFSHLDVKANLLYGVKRAARKSNAQLFAQSVDTMGIGALLQRYPQQLSGGERQRVAIARALLVQPRVLLMDEPLAALDSSRKQEILPYLERLRSGTTSPILYVTHALDEVSRLADHLLILDRGRSVAEGPVNEVLSRIDLPHHLGEERSVVLNGEVVERDTRWQLARVRIDGFDLWIRDGGDALQQPVRVRIMARDISLALTSRDDTSILNRIRVEVLSVAPDCDEAIALVRLKAGTAILVARITRRSAAHLSLAPGKLLWAQIKSAAVVR